jgi:putative transcriptional regulator
LKTVVLLCDYMPEGAFGLVLNRPTEVPATAMVKLEPELQHGNELPLYIGGPVEPQRGWILLSEPPPDGEYRTIMDGIHLSTSPMVLRRVLETRPAPRARVFAGYAGWGPGQLDEELAQSSWLMSDVELDIVFDVEPAVMWETAIRRLGADPSSLSASHGVH